MSTHVCPWWLGYVLLNPIRNLLQDPARFLSPHLEQGMTAIDIGCGMGYFSIPMAKAVGETGRVIAVDLQQKMLDSLMLRAENAGLSHRLEPRICESNTLGISDLNEQVDFALAFAVVHEVPDPLGLFGQIYRALKKKGRLLIAEPSFHVSEKEFNDTVHNAVICGFTMVSVYPKKIWGRSVLLEK